MLEKFRLPTLFVWYELKYIFSQKGIYFTCVFALKKKKTKKQKFNMKTQEDTFWKML